MLSVVVSLCGMLCVGGFVPAAWAAEGKEFNYQVITCKDVEKLNPKQQSDPWEIGYAGKTYKMLHIFGASNPAKEREWLDELSNKLHWSWSSTCGAGNIQGMMPREARKVRLSTLSERYLTHFVLGVTGGSTTFLVPIFDFDILRACAVIKGFEGAKKACFQKGNEEFEWVKKTYLSKHKGDVAEFERQAKKVAGGLTLKFCVPEGGCQQFSSDLGALKVILPRLLNLKSVDDQVQLLEKLPCILKFREEGKKKSSE